MRSLHTLIFLFVLALYLASQGQHEASGVCLLILVVWFFNLHKVAFLILHKLTRRAPKKIFKLEQGFQISQVELTKPMDYLHETYPGKNDAEILQIREQEMIKILDGFCKSYDKSDHTKHFKFRVYYAYPNNEQELVAHFEPITPIANEFLSKAMNQKMKEEGMFIEEEAE